MSPLPRMRIGVPVIADGGWMGGVQYIVHLVTALNRLPADERPEIVLVVRPHTIGSLQAHNEILPMVSDVIIWPFERTELAKPGVRIIPSVDGLFEHVDLVVPGHLMAVPGKPIASWIPDFQHHHLPELFPASDLRARDEAFSQIARMADLVMLSSHAARRDWERFYPDAKPTVRVMPFRAAPETAWFEGDPEAVAAKHGLRAPFLMCCNQFWIHKGHDTLVKALGLLQREGLSPHLVCTGAMTDYRSSVYIDELRGAMDASGVRAQVHMLGLVPRAEQIALVRRSLAVIQPSRFEGWSTVVEDARLLGKTLLMSDIDVHVEQAPRHGHYFRVGDAADLAAKLCQLLPSLEVGPNLERERAARAEADELLLDYGRRIVALAREMPDILAGKAPRTVAEPLLGERSFGHEVSAAAPLDGVLSRLRLHVEGVSKPRL